MPSRARLTLTLACLAIAACVGGSGAGVPEINPERLVTVKFDSVIPRRITLQINDQRRPLPANSDTMLAEVTRAVTTILERAGIAVVPEAPSQLVFDFSYPDSAAVKGLDPVDCIVMNGSLHFPNDADAHSMAESCWGGKNLYGMRMSNDVNGVYEYVINGNMKTLDEVWNPRPKKPGT